MPHLYRSLSTALIMLLSAFTALAVVYDDVEPEVTARVARVSFIRGDVKVRRSDSDEWETATLNLPLVEGDELSTGEGGRVELQFGLSTHLRADEAAYLQIKQLSESGIAISVSAGTVTARLRKFDAEKEFFEMDAPGTTVAVQAAGSYRIDAGEPNSPELRVTASGGGEARVYSANSGFPLRSGRSAKVFIAGDYAGEWDTDDASHFADEFDRWSAERDDVIARRLDSANYGTYYDQDIYGADELNENGSWEHTSDYGYVWQPNAAAIRSYSDWSPYRYGSWRWVSPFGWTWVNDEPWGWATYHHGRWIWYRGRWVWTPYGQYRSNRSWWYPALVVIRVVNRNVCWYPLGYRQRYYSYSRGHHNWPGNRGRRPRNEDRPPTGGGGTPPVVPGRPPRERQPIEWGPGDGSGGRSSDAKTAVAEIPPTGVISVSAENFGVTRRFGQPAPPEVAREVLAKRGSAELPPLPDPQEIRRRPGRDFMAQPPQVAKVPSGTGAGERRRDQPLDRELLKTRVFGNRPPVQDPPEVRTQPGGQEIPRRTGAVGRPAPPRREVLTSPVDRAPGGQPAPTNEPPRYVPPRSETPKPREDRVIVPQPRHDAPKPREESPRLEPPRRDPPAPKQDKPAPRFEPQPRLDPPAPRQSPPPRSEPPPRSDPPPRRDPPPKSTPPRSDPPKPALKPAQGSRKASPVD